MIKKLWCLIWGHKLVGKVFTGKYAEIYDRSIMGIVKIPIMGKRKSDFCLRCGNPQKGDWLDKTAWVDGKLYSISFPDRPISYRAYQYKWWFLNHKGGWGISSYHKSEEEFLGMFHREQKPQKWGRIDESKRPAK